MLVRFSVENFLSFRERVELSMVASRTVDNNDADVIWPNTSSGIPLLKLAVIYGANASGKSNLVKAISVARDLILHPPEAARDIPYSPFKLDPKCQRAPTRFEFEIEIGDRYFAYGFAVTSKRVEGEWLYEVACEPESRIFERSKNVNLLGDLPFEGAEEEQLLRFTMKGTLPNRLFLTECRERNVRENVRGAKAIVDLLDWFERGPLIIFPESGFVALESSMYESTKFRAELGRYLNCFDTGITGIDLDKVDSESLGISASLRHSLEARTETRKPVLLQAPNNVYLLFDRDKEGRLRTRRMVARHGPSGSVRSGVAFDLGEESDGTLRLIDLLPAIMALTTREVTWVIDELDRSLHPEILHSYLANFLKYSKGIGSQLVVTTHDTTLLRQPFLRRDEVWFVEKGMDQSSRLIALEEFKKTPGGNDLQQDYLQGRFGGVPVIRDFSWLGEADGKGA